MRLALALCLRCVRYALLLPQRMLRNGDAIVEHNRQKGEFSSRSGALDQQTIHDGSELPNRMLESFVVVVPYTSRVFVLYGCMQPEPPSANGVRAFLFEWCRCVRPACGKQTKDVLCVESRTQKVQ